MNSVKIIPVHMWPDYLCMFTDANKGRLLMLKSISREEGDTLLSDGSPPLAVDYDPVHKGNDLVISLGKTEIEYAYIFKAPVELSETHHPNGQVQSLEILDQNANKIVLEFE